MSNNNHTRNNRNGGSSCRGPRREQKKNMDYEARVTRKGISANHLLNFSMPERDNSVHHHQKKKKSLAPRTQAEYLHANYRFVIAPFDPDADVPTWDFEALTEWSCVEQVLLWYDVESPHTCPICMDTFRAPKITKCGHIFCWPCILRYLSMTEKYWRRCPMCFESVQKGHLRSVQLTQVQIPPRVGSNATFQFLERPKSSMFPQRRVLSPVNVEAEDIKPDSSSRSEVAALAERKRSRMLPSVHDVDAMYSRILEATPEYLQNMLHSEMDDLQSMDAEFRSSGDVDNLPFVEEAMRNTSGRLTMSNDFGRGTYGSSPAHSTATTTNVAKRKSHANDSGDAYSFYQIANGTYVILHPLNMKCLLKEFSDERQHELNSEHAEDAQELEITWTQVAARLEPVSVNRYYLLPEKVHGRILDIEHVVMDEEAQKRYRFLNHLPRFCDFYVCELDLTPQLSPSTLNVFRHELKKRAKLRKHKVKLQNAPTLSSPIYRSTTSTFSLEQEGTMWPSPYEQSLAESLEKFTLPKSLKIKLERELQTAVYDDEQSFACVTENSGYFPALGSGTVDDARPSVTDSTEFRLPSAWGNVSSTQPSVASAGSGKGGKKKGSNKKGISVFSTTQRRSYR
ncbi:unnamed protein product [Peronospora belbahrii]|uniref:RING-type domain-containing protein n=1 Tax=Peronospora belbahrii TaxID=622444 RepID=A0AAU9LBA0_9STRA|nr:unnamed protein product [Peronospora belbahrii]CAH0517340.1 unnamed protein product [Peronospora belbahrii]